MTDQRVGILYQNFINGIVRPDVPNRFEDVFIDRKHLNGAPFGMRVVCRIIDPGDGDAYTYATRDEFSGKGMPRGEIIEILGDPLSNDATMKGIMAAHDLSEKFPDVVSEEIKKFPDEVTDDAIQQEIATGRADYRSLHVVTIDGEDTKDIDDGLSLTIEDGWYNLGVHIADVSHYVTDETPLDREALERATSVYLADRVIPMLPPLLSNNLCSLNPKKPRFALSAMMRYDRNANLHSLVVHESVIESKDRLTYTEVQKVISGGDNEGIPDYLDNHKSMLRDLHVLAQKLRKRRFENGSIDFAFTETKLELDAEKRPVRIFPAEHHSAHEMIEECMIACNAAIAEKFESARIPFLYRVHQSPDPEKIRALSALARRLGEEIKLPAKPSSKDIQNLIRRLDDKPYKDTLLHLILRAMPKATYEDSPFGHFGLALEHYCHFTSPIRRYPDLFIHRIIKTAIRSKPLKKRWKEAVKDIALRCSDREINAMTAERESVDYKIAEYMNRHIGDIFPGTISGITGFGLFVRLANTAEGMAPYRTMSGYYEFLEEEMAVTIPGKKRLLRLGDAVTVKVVRADLVARRTEFLMVEAQDRESLFMKVEGKNRSKGKKSVKGKKNTRGKRRL